MAGIGFRLRELSQEDTPWSSLQVYLLSAFVSSGPWLITTVNLFFISLWNPGGIDDVDRAALFAIISYAMAASFVFVGAFSLAFTRYLADQIYLERQEKLLPALNGFLTLILVVAGTGGFLFLRVLPLSSFVKFCALMLFLGLNLLWVLMIYLSALRDYYAIVWAFLGGAIAGWGFLCAFSGWEGLAGRLLGFTFGQLLTAAFLANRLFKELGGRQGISFEFLKSFRERPYLLGAGLFYHLGFWIDKFVFWHSRYRLVIAGLPLCPFYDTALFFAQLSLMPTMTLFLVHIETNFYEQYRNYYREAINKQPLRVILSGKRGIHKALREGIELLLKYQGVVSLLAIASVHFIAPYLHLDPAQVPMTRVALLGAFVQSMLHVFFILLLYFDLQRQGFWVSFLFAASVGLFSRWSLSGGVPFFGYGYLGGCVVALLAAFYSLNRVAAQLEYETFAKQPMVTAS